MKSRGVGNYYQIIRIQKSKLYWKPSNGKDCWYYASKNFVGNYLKLYYEPNVLVPWDYFTLLFLLERMKIFNSRGDWKNYNNF